MLTGKYRALLQGLVLDDEKVHTASGQCKRHLLGLKEILEVLLDVCKRRMGC